MVGTVAALFMSRALNRLRTQFREPARSYRPLAVWLWNGELQEAELGRQVREFAAKGFGGLLVQPRPGLRLGDTEERWWDAFGYALRKASEAGLPIWIYEDVSSATGQRGAPDARTHANLEAVLAGGSEHQAKTLARSIYEVEEPTQINLEGRFPQGTPLVHLAARLSPTGELDPDSFVDLTTESSWTCPEGKWRLVSFAAQTIDDQIDYLQPETGKRFVETVYEPYAKRFPTALGKGIAGVFASGSHLASQPIPWTAKLAERFEADHGYALLPKLPMLVFRAGRETVKVRCDFYATVAGLYAEAWFQQIGEWCQRHDLAWSGHTEEHVAFQPARQGQYFTTLRHFAIPASDVHGFRYSRPRDVQPAELRPAVSIAKMMKRGRSAAEAFGGSGWGTTIDELRGGLNLLAALGVDTPVIRGFHASLDSPAAIADLPPSLFSQNPYWEHFGQVTDYASRLSALIGNTSGATSTAVLLPATSVAANTADGRPNRRADEIAQTFEDLVDGLFARGVSAYVVDDAFLVDARLEKGSLRLGTLSVDTIVLPPLPVLTRAGARRLLALARSGGRVMSVGEHATASVDTGSNDGSVMRSMESLFGARASGKQGRKVGKGRSHAFEGLTDQTLASIVSLVRPDAVIVSEAGAARVVARTLDGADAFLVLNTGSDEHSVKAKVRSRGGAEVWDPETGASETLRLSGGRAAREFELTLPPRAARVVVFDYSARPTSTSRRARRASHVEPIDLSPDWQFVLETGVATGPGSIRRLELPVMRFRDFSLGQRRLEQLRDPLFDDSDWRVLWLTCPAARVVGNWRAEWITGVARPQGWVVLPQSDRHSRLRFVKKFSVSEPPIKAWATFVGVEKVTVYLNGTRLGESEDWSNPVTYNVMPYLRLGENTIVADVENARPGPLVFLFEAQIDVRSGDSVVIVSDESWGVQAPRQEIWNGLAYERDTPIVPWSRGRPPVPPWGQIPLLSETVKFPRTLMYRQRLPVGCVGIAIPAIKGGHNVFVDVRERTPDINGIYNITTGSLLSIEIAASDFSNGVLQPLTLFTRPTGISLQSWSSLGYDWYSGVAAYERTFDLPVAPGGSRVTLDLGDVRHQAEVIVNNRRIGARLWPPYVFDLTGVVQKGSNSLRVRVGNLLANRMRWRREESRASDPWHRYWHQDSIEPERLESGLLGPVELYVD